MRQAGSAAVRSPAAWLLTLAIVLIALNLRGPIVATAPVLGQMSSDLGLTAVVAGLLTSIPVLCFALASPLASSLIVKVGAERAVSIGLAGVLLGTVLRALGTSSWLYVGTIVIGIAITVGNVVLPVIIRRDYTPERAGFVTGIYTSALNVGSMITSLATAPIASVVGWPAALVGWGLLAVLAVAVWAVAVGPRVALGVGSRTAAGAVDAGGASTADVITGGIDVVETAAHEADAEARRRPLLRRWTTWGLTLAFAGQAFAYYGLTAWMPTLLGDEIGLTREAAGASSSVFQIMAVVGALGVPLLALRWRPSAVIALIGVLWTAMPLGLFFAPEHWLVWSIFGGAAQGGGITIIFIVIVRMASNGDDARRLSALVQGGGYAIASLGPLAIGGLHDASGGWELPMVGIFVSVLVLGVSGVLSARRVS
ncbi:MFS transporter [Frigoribacterium sp. ACAM 257]|uniref:MFS transporter n=1 Tax=Frigoribacterium sp. ACAM 257 TaxID=2508998 RepID=UPI0011B9CC40|nr:MFS transporter [Frigoribacterium sp. ACAM 257]TWX38337.1 MFS transporter [Frigoribacterium sp. ACAM 257]